MKFGFRKPSFKKSIKARTTGKWKRQMKSSINPLYGKKGTGMIRNPKKSVYNKVYNKRTVGVNPLAGLLSSTKKKQAKGHKSSHSPNSIAYTKHKTIEKTVPVTNPIEKFVRRLFNKENSESKVIQEKVIVEQYTYQEVTDILETVDQLVKDYNEAVRYAESTVNAEVFFPRLIGAEEALKEASSAIHHYSFIENEGDNIDEALSKFLKEKESMIQRFVDKHFESCVESAEELKTQQGKVNRYASNYEELTEYFSKLPTSSVNYIQEKWQGKLIK